MKLIFEKSREGRGLSILPPGDVPRTALPQALCREAPLRLPQVAECDIDRHYAYKESLPENHQFIAENGKETLAQVFTDVRYTKKDAEAMSK